MTVQVKINQEAAAILDALTSPYGKGRLISGLLAIAGERWQEIEQGRSVPMDRLSRLLLDEQRQRVSGQARAERAAKKAQK